ncbi:hypothetical protein ES703_109201 [subsurface metagenome]
MVKDGGESWFINNNKGFSVAVTKTAYGNYTGINLLFC